MGLCIDRVSWIRCLGANLCACCAGDHEATHVRFAHETKSVLTVGRDELTGAVMLAPPTHVSHDLTIALLRSTRCR